MLRVTATLSLFAVEDGGLKGLLSEPSRALLLEPDVHGFRERTGWDCFGMQITTSGGRGLGPGQEAVAAELLFWAPEARPWVEVDSEFHLVVPPRRVGRGRVTRVLESGVDRC